MRRSIMNVLANAKAQLSGYAALLNYRFMNLCVKAEAPALLSVTVEVGNKKLDIEKTAMARITPGRPDQFEIYPLDHSLIFPISRGIVKAHPEFKIEEKSVGGSEAEEDKYLLVTMPVVNKDRRDALKNGVSALSDECKVNMDVAYSKYLGQVVSKLVGAPAGEIDEAKEELQNLYDEHSKLCKAYRADKEKEIDEAYQRYTTERSEAAARQQETDAAHGRGKGLSMRMMREDE